MLVTFHTPGPLVARVKLITTADGSRTIASTANIHTGEARDMMLDEKIEFDRQNKANTRRLVDCYNACEGLDPSAIQDLVQAARALIDLTAGEGPHAEEFSRRLDDWDSENVFVNLLAACDRVQNRA